MYLGASDATNICAPTALPTQYAMKRTVAVTVFLVLPATFDGKNVQITASRSVAASLIACLTYSNLEDYRRLARCTFPT